VTPTINGGICVYAYTDDLGIVKCAFERAWKEGKISFQKPISCHLYPIRVKDMNGYEAVNYEPRKTLCKPACKLGQKLKVPVYQFLKDSLIRKYGKEFYETLDAVAKKMAKDKSE
jgi:O-phosphoseryl-tRNA(Cys) synthetase